MIIVNNRGNKKFKDLKQGDIFSIRNSNGVIEYFMKTDEIEDDNGYSLNTVDLQFGEISFTEANEEVTPVVAKLVID